MPENKKYSNPYLAGKMVKNKLNNKIEVPVALGVGIVFDNSF
jgi:hypothetical protein